MRKITRVTMALFLCFAMVLALASCSGGNSDSETGSGTEGATDSAEGDAADSSADDTADSSTDAVESKDSLNVAVSLDSGTLDPIGITGSGGFLTVATTYLEPLLDVKANGEYEWVLATGFDTVSELNSTIHLREDVTFSNGNPLTAEDVMFTLNLYKDDPIHTIYVMYVDFEKTKIIDDYTIDFWYTEFIVNQATIFSQVLVVDAESYNAEEMSTNPIGTGPYTVTDYVVNSHTTIKARDDYWGEKPAIPNITFKCLNEESQVVNALETNDVDVAQLPISDAEYIKTLDRYTIGESNGGAGVAAFYNMSPDSPLATKEARYAVDYAIDRQSILDVAYGGYGTITNWPASGALLDFEDRFNNLHETYSVGYDIAKAKELAEQSDLVGKSLRIITNGSDQFITAAEIIQADLLEIGVNAEIVNYDQATYYSMLMDVSNFEIALYFTAVPAKVASGIFATTLTTFLPLGWEGPEREAYLKVAGEALTTVDEAERSEKLFETVKMFVEISPWFGICDMLSLQAYVSGLNGMDYYLTGDVRYQNLSFS